MKFTKIQMPIKTANNKSEQKEFISQYRKNTLKYLHENKLLIDYICNKEISKVN